MKRFGPKDFGYSFVGYDDPPNSEKEDTNKEDNNENINIASTVEESFVYDPTARRHGGNIRNAHGDDVEVGKDQMVMFATSIGACCCCLTVIFLIVGGILISYEKFNDSDNEIVYVGLIVLILALAASICGCCLLWISCCTSAILPSSTEDDGSDPHHKDIKVRFRRLNDLYEKAEDDLNHVRLDVIGDGMKEMKLAEKKEADQGKEKEKKNREELERRVKKDIEAGVSVKEIRQNYRPVVFFIRFEGDAFVSNMELLRKQVSLVVNLGRARVDQAVVVVTSPGGGVAEYGLAASQLVRIRKAGIKLVVCVDKIAASGGYMMASVADVIYAAPFAIVGSIGVVTQIPNIQRFLNKHEIDAYLFTAGKHKRTVDMIGDVTEEGKNKLQEELDEMHIIFKDHVALARPKLKETIEEIATGEHWLAVQAKEKGLVDEIMTSDEYLESVSKKYDIIEITEKKKRRYLPDLHAAVRTVKTAVEGTSLQSSTPMAIS